MPPPAPILPPAHWQTQHSPLEQLLALVEVVVLVAHEIQHSPGRLLLEGAAVAAHTQPAKGGDQSSPHTGWDGTAAGASPDLPPLTLKVLGPVWDVEVLILLCRLLWLFPGTIFSSSAPFSLLAPHIGEHILDGDSGGIWEPCPPKSLHQPPSPSTIWGPWCCQQQANAALQQLTPSMTPLPGGLPALLPHPGAREGPGTPPAL